MFGKDERGMHILRRRSEDAPVEAGVMEPLAEGRPITGEVISLRQRKDLPFLFDVKTVLEGQTGDRAGDGDGAGDGAGDADDKIGRASCRERVYVLV